MTLTPPSIYSLAAILGQHDYSDDEIGCTCSDTECYLLTGLVKYCDLGERCAEEYLPNDGEENPIPAIAFEQDSSAKLPLPMGMWPEYYHTFDMGRTHPIYSAPEMFSMCDDNPVGSFLVEIASESNCSSSASSLITTLYK